MTTTTKSVITMSQRARLHDRIYPPRNAGTGSLPRSPQFARTKWFLPAGPAVAHDPVETESAVDLAAASRGVSAARSKIPEFDEVRRTRSHADGGIDLVVVNTTPFVGGRAAIQAKRYATHRKVDIAAVREIVGSILQREFNKGIIVTTSRFTKAAVRKQYGLGSNSTTASGCCGYFATTCTANSMP